MTPTSEGKRMLDFDATTEVLAEIADERGRQDEKWGQQDHPDGTDWTFRSQANAYRALCDGATEAGSLTWRHIFQEEAYEALAEKHADKLRAELVQVAAVAVSWIEAIDRRTA